MNQNAPGDAVVVRLKVHGTTAYERSTYRDLRVNGISARSASLVVFGMVLGRKFAVKMLNEPEPVPMIERNRRPS